MRTSRCRSGGFTLAELVILLAVLAILIALLLPAVWAAREAARNVQSKNNLRQIAIASHTHVMQHEYYPSGGWGWRWAGDPDRGFGRDQPGGWVFNILPYIERANVYRLAADEEADKWTDKQLEGAAMTLQTPMPIFYAPARRLPQVYPTDSRSEGFDGEGRFLPRGSNPVKGAARIDYAMCAGDQKDLGIIAGPESLEKAADFKWPDMTAATGVSFLRSQITQASIRDGTSNTYLVGEKYLNKNDYETGLDPGDNIAAYCGYDDDLYRSTYYDEATGKGYAPMEDESGTTDAKAFGGPHRGGFNMALCDGSVRAIQYNVDPKVHQRLGNRKDGERIDRSEF